LIVGGAIRSGKRTRLLKYALAHDIPIVTSRDEFVEFVKNHKPTPEGKTTIVVIDGFSMASLYQEQAQRRERQKELEAQLFYLFSDSRRRSWDFIMGGTRRGSWDVLIGDLK